MPHPSEMCSHARASIISAGQHVASALLRSPALQAPLPHGAVKTELWDAGPRRLVMEPLFVPRANSAAEDDGWVLATVHNPVTGKGELVILDAQDLAAGPVATIHLQHFLPAGLHGSFTPHVFGHELKDSFSAEPLWKTPNVVRQI